MMSQWYKCGSYVCMYVCAIYTWIMYNGVNMLMLYSTAGISGNIDVGGSKYEDYGVIASGSEYLLMGRKVHKNVYLFIYQTLVQR